jgi:hypothetical protein
MFQIVTWDSPNDNENILVSFIFYLYIESCDIMSEGAEDAQFVRTFKLEEIECHFYEDITDTVHLALTYGTF